MDSELSEIHNFLQISDNLATAGRPTEDQLAMLQQAGYHLVINLALPKQPNALPNEDEIVTDLGMEYINIPVVFNNPTAAELDQMMDALEPMPHRSALFIASPITAFRPLSSSTACCAWAYHRPRRRSNCTKFGSLTRYGRILSRWSWRGESTRSSCWRIHIRLARCFLYTVNQISWYTVYCL